MLRRLRPLFRSARVERELDAELRFDIERRIEALVAAGLGEREARRRVALDFGGLDQVKEQCREARSVALIESIAQDFRYALRGLRKSPMFTAVALLSLALGIGANSTVFSLVDTILFRPQGARDDRELVQIYATTATRRAARLSYPDYLDLHRESKSVSDMFAFWRSGFALNENGRTTVVFGQTVSPNYFDAVRVRPFVGRGFLPSEDKAGSADAVVLSYGYWQRHFGGDRSLIGKEMILNSRSTVVAGVMSKDFQGTDMMATDMWVVAKDDALRSDRNFSVSGRLRAGVSKPAAQAEIAAFLKALGETYAGKDKLTGAMVGQESESAKRKVFGSIPLVLVGFVLLIACATVKNLLFARAEARRREIAMRQALGASRGRLVRQLLTEGLVLSAIAGALGLLLAGWLIRLLPRMLPSLGFQLPYEFSIDARVLAFAAGASALTTVVFGLGPSLQLTRAGLLPALQGQENKALLGLRGLSGRKFLVAAQIAISLALMIGAGLLTRSLLNLNRVDIGFEKKPMLLMMVVNPGASPAAARAFQADIEARVRAIPGVRGVSSTTRVPLSTFGGGLTQEVVVDGSPLTLDRPASVRYSAVGVDYFTVMGTRLLHGRHFSASDDEHAPKVAIINDTFARRFWPGQNPVGKHFRTDGTSGDTGAADWEVVGVAQDGKYLNVNEQPAPYILCPMAQASRPETTLIVETSVDPSSISGPLMREVHALNPTVTLDAVTMKEHLRTAMWTQDAVAKLVAGFGLMALFLTCIGLYGVVAYAVSRRTREIGVRMALGATRGTVLGQILRQGFVLALAGSAAGLALSFAVTRSLASFLYGVSPFDPLVFSVTTLLVFGVTMLATFIPARKAMSVNPVVALRHE